MFQIRNNIIDGGLLNANSPSFGELTKNRKKALPFCTCRSSVTKVAKECKWGGVENYFTNNINHERSKEKTYKVPGLEGFLLATSLAEGEVDCHFCGHAVFWSTKYMLSSKIQEYSTELIDHHLESFYENGY